VVSAVEIGSNSSDWLVGSTRTRGRMMRVVRRIVEKREPPKAPTSVAVVGVGLAHDR
jgi:hypothetical protein